MQKRKIPVFYHIPKNAGTYVSDWFVIAFRYYWNILIINPQKYKNPSKDFSDLRNSIKCIQVTKNNVIVAKIFVKNPFCFCESFSGFGTKHSIFEWDIDIQNITKELLANVELFGIIIESHGFKNRKDIFNLFPNADMYHFLILRDAFHRAQSIYHYNISETSTHDYSHGLIKSNTFEDYVLSEELEDCWLIRNIVNVDDSIELEEHHFNEAINILKFFEIYDIKDTDRALQDAFLKCYNFDIQKIKLNPWDNFSKNETSTKKINFAELSLIAQQTFNQRTVFDNKLYKTLLKI